MRAGKSLIVSPEDIGRPKGLIQDRNSPQKHVWRAEIVPLTADGVGTNEIMRRAAKSKTCVWRWQERFIEDGSTVSFATRPSRIKPLGPEAAERVVALTLSEPAGEQPKWTGASMAKAAGGALTSSSPIGCASSSCPTTPRFVDKLRDVVGL